MFEQATRGEPRNQFCDWMFRGAIAFALGQAISSNRYRPMVPVFHGRGGILGGVLVLIPSIVTTGLMLLACTMASAALIPAFVIGRPADSVFFGVFFGDLPAFWWNRRSR